MDYLRELQRRQSALLARLLTMESSREDSDETDATSQRLAAGYSPESGWHDRPLHESHGICIADQTYTVSYRVAEFLARQSPRYTSGR